MSYQREGKPPPNIEGMHSLKIDNITSRTGPNELRDVFSKFGEIGDIHIPKDRWSGENKGFAFVRFYAKRDAEEALDRMDGRRVDGREIRVTTARYGRPCDERAERRARGEYYRDRDRDDRYSRRSRSRSRSGGRRRSRSRSRSKERRSAREDSSRRRNGAEHRRRSSKSKSRSRSRSRSGSRRRSSPRSRSRSD